MDEPLTVLLLTYGEQEARREYAYRTLHTTLDHLGYDGPLFVHIADDGSPPEHRSVCGEIAGGYGHVRAVSITNSERGGYGANYNLATQAFHHRGGYVLPLEDDWELREHIDATSLVAAMQETPLIRCIRLGYLGWTQPLRGEFMSAVGRAFLILDPDSPERHVFAGHPRIETVSYEQDIGPWPVGIDPGTTEHVVAGRPASRVGVAWPMDLPRVFHHIGAVQARTDQLAGEPV